VVCVTWDDLLYRAGFVWFFCATDCNSICVILLALSDVMFMGKPSVFEIGSALDTWKLLSLSLALLINKYASNFLSLLTIQVL